MTRIRDGEDGQAVTGASADRRDCAVLKNQSCWRAATELDLLEYPSTEYVTAYSVSLDFALRISDTVFLHRIPHTPASQTHHFPML